MDEQTFVDLLATAIEEHGESLRAAADHLGVTQPQVSKWLNGTDVPSDHRAQRLADYAGVPLEQIVMALHRWRSTPRAERARPLVTLELSVEELARSVIAVRHEIGRRQGDPSGQEAMRRILAQMERAVDRLGPEDRVELQRLLEEE